MNNFFRGVLVGVGVGLLIAPMRGQEMRTLLSERVQGLRGYLPESEQLNQYTQQVSDRVSQTASNLKDYAQQAATNMKESGNSLADLARQATTTIKGTGNSLTDLAQKTATDVKQAGKDVADTTKQATARAVKDNTAAPFPSAYPEYVNPETK